MISSWRTFRQIDVFSFVTECKFFRKDFVTVTRKFSSDFGFCTSLGPSLTLVKIPNYILSRIVSAWIEEYLKIEKPTILDILCIFNILSCAKFCKLLVGLVCYYEKCSWMISSKILLKHIFRDWFWFVKFSWLLDISRIWF
jgi:hypothetical protein